MAFIDQQDDDDLNAQNPQAPGASGGPAPLVGAGSSNVGNNTVSQAGVGAGGGGGWTNIQAYLGANKNDSGSSQALNKEVSGQFNKERDAYTADSTKYTQDAEKQLGESKVTTGQASDLINQNKSAYTWGNTASAPTGGKGALPGASSSTTAQEKVTPGSSWDQAPGQLAQNPESYDQNVNKVRGFLQNDYSGPRSYQYALGADTQNMGANLKDSGGFDRLMNNIYSKNANSPLTSGQFQLQKQLEVNNQNLVDTRSNLQNAYTGLEQGRDKAVTDTTKKLGGFEQDYRTSRNVLADFLGAQSNASESAVGQEEANARAAYKEKYQGHSGLENIFNGGLDDASGGGTENMADRGVWGDQRGDNLTWEQVQREQNLGAKGNTDFWYNVLNDGRGGNTGEAQARQQQLRGRFGENASSLKDFYSEQDNKYADTADEQKRTYNVLQDFLNSNTDRKKQGFRVRD